jgi:hypothetical protein
MNELELLDRIYMDVVTAMRNANRAQEHLSPEDVRAYIQSRLQQQGYQGPDLQTPQDLVERVRQIEAAPDMASAIAVNAAQGMTFGLLDEAVGFFSEEAKDEMRRIKKTSREELPWYATYLPEIVGSFAAPGAAASATARAGAGLGRTALAAGGVGALESAIAGFGEAEGTPIERLPQTLKSGAIGGVLGTILGGAGYGAGKIYRSLTGKTGQTVEEQARELVQRSAGPRGAEGVAEDLARMQDVTPSATLADVPEMRPLARGAAAESRAARDRFREVMIPRTREAHERVDDYLTRAVQETDVPPTVAARRTSLQSRLASGQQAYRQLEATVTDVMTKDLGAALTNRLAFRAWKKANDEIVAAGGEPLRRVIIKKGDDFVLSGTPADFRTLQAIKGGLDDAVSGAGRKRSTMRIRAQARDRFSTAMDEAVAGFGDAQRVWHSLNQEARAIADGANFLRRSADGVGEDMARYAGNQAAQDAYRLSAAEHLSDEIRRKARRADPTRAVSAQVLDPSPEMEAKLAQLFPDEAGFARFLDEIDVERELMMSTRAQTRGAEGGVVDITRSLQEGAPGAELLQRASIIPVAPGVGTARIGADIAQSALTRRARERAGQVSGLLGRQMTGSRLDATNLLMGSPGGRMPGLGSFMQFRSPAALLMAMQDR